MSKKVRRIKIRDKEYSLNDIWRLCLKMWKDIHTTNKLIPDIKRKWMEAHGFSDDVRADCFFCEWNDQNEEYDTDKCSACPGKLVSKRFSCVNDSYHYRWEPRKFYRKILWLDKKRRNQ